MLERELDIPLYQQLADEIGQDIQSGVYLPGHKVPSLRKMSERKGVSISTVSQSYAWLEDQGCLIARPQSGYYVRPVMHSDQAPASLTPSEPPSEVTKAALINSLLQQLNIKGFINLGASVPEPSLLPQRQLQQHIQKVSRFHISEVLDYQFSPGHPGLRQQLAIRMRDVQVGCQADDIVMTHGCAEALTLCLRATTQPGDLVAVESPCYYGFLQLAANMGLKILEIPTDPSTGISTAALELALQQWPVKLVALTARFSNPTGALMPIQNQRRVVELARQYDVGILEDDIYGEIFYSADIRSSQASTAEQAGMRSVLKAFDTDERVMYCSSFSKTLSAGLRVGWCLPARWRKQVVEQQTFTTFSASSLSQHTVHSYLQSGSFDRHLRRLRKQMGETQQQFVEAIRRYFPQDIRINLPLGGYCLWIELPEGVKASQLYYLAREEFISISPGGLFSNSQRFDGHVRINISRLWNPQIEQALAALGRLVKGLVQGSMQGLSSAVE
ncbi:MAG: PLP-dependent aminotransferase family protein [Oceanobacter sp.]